MGPDLRKRSALFLENFSALWILSRYVCGDAFFFLHSVEETEGEDGDGCYALDDQEFVCQRALVLVMGPSRGFGSRDEA